VLSLNKTLAMFGVRPQFIRRGEFKTAPELFTRDRISPAQEKTITGLLDERVDTLLEAVAAGRKQSLDQSKAALEVGPYSARRAVEAHLADAVADPAGIEDELKEKIGKNVEIVPYGEVEGAERREKPRFRPLRPPAFAAVVPVHGIITVGDGRSGSSGAVAGSDSVVASIQQAVESKQAKSILLHIESRGGSATASELIHAAVQRAAKEKPVLCYVDGIAASGGYMVAVAAKQIWCAKEAIVGSIGVFGGKFDVEGLFAALQVGVDSIQRGKHAGLNSPFRPWSTDELAVLDREIEETYRDFVRLVAEGRHLTEDVVHGLGEGRIFTGVRAEQAKLVDGLCGFGEAIAKTYALGGLDAEAPLAWIDATPRTTSPLQLLRGATRERMWALWTGNLPA
jgi:protease-4